MIFIVQFTRFSEARRTNFFDDKKISK